MEEKKIPNVVLQVQDSVLDLTEVYEQLDKQIKEKMEVKENG
jgi:hypothetical protein